MNDTAEARRAAFERLERMVKPVSDLDEEKELDDWRWEKFGVGILRPQPATDTSTGFNTQ